MRTTALVLRALSGSIVPSVQTSMIRLSKLVDWPTRAETTDGEKLVLVTDRRDADVAQLAEWARSHGAPELAVPKKIMKVGEVPVLGTGKTDYVAIQQMAELDRAA